MGAWGFSVPQCAEGLLSLDEAGGDADLLRRSLCRTASVFGDLFAPFSLHWGFPFPIRGTVMTP